MRLRFYKSNKELKNYKKSNKLNRLSSKNQKHYLKKRIMIIKLFKMKQFSYRNSWSQMNYF